MLSCNIVGRDDPGLVKIIEQKWGMMLLLHNNIGDE